MERLVALPLTSAQQSVADRVVAQESRARYHLVIYLSGAHAYGFPSPDSDLDLKAIHIARMRDLLSLSPPRQTRDRLELIDGVEIDYTSNELQPALAGVLGGNGNYLERILGELTVHGSQELAELRPLVQRSLSRRAYRHYAGFARSQLEAVVKAEQPTAKQVLYVVRTALTGTHLLRSTRLVTDMTCLMDEYSFDAANELLERKQAGERAQLTELERDRWVTRLHSALSELAEANEQSPLPPEPTNTAELEAWLLETRQRHWQ